MKTKKGNGVAVIVLAAGFGKRMKSTLPKVLHEISGKPIISFLVDLVASLKASPVVFVLGKGIGLVRGQIPKKKGFRVVEQKQKLGTAHATAQAQGILKNFKGTILILNGDVPLLKPETVKGFLKEHMRAKADISILTTTMPDPRGYGRIIKDHEGNLVKIVEELDAKGGQQHIAEVNTGLYAIKGPILFPLLKKIKKNKKKGEYYLTDILEIAKTQGPKALTIKAIHHDDYLELMGINNRQDLAVADYYQRNKINRDHMLNGVTIINPEVTYLGMDVKIGRDTVIEPGSHIKGKTKIGIACRIGAGSIIRDSKIEDVVTIEPYSIIESSSVKSGAKIGPFGRLRPGSIVEAGAKVGNFVELKKTRLGTGSKANHLTYLGDAVIGKNVNVGAGTITCNYDGYEKHTTRIKDGAFIGSDTQFIAPVTIGRNSYIGAGSTITDDVPDGSLALSRSPQASVRPWKKKRKKKSR